MIKNKVKPNVLMVSTSKSGKGGIASVVSTYIQGGLLNDNNIDFLVTHIEGGGVKKLSNFISSLLKLPYFLVSKRITVFHIHTASRSSFIRKSIVSWLGMVFGKKIILHLHGGEFMQYYNDESGAFIKWYISRTFNAVNKVVVLTPQWKINIQTIASNANISVIFNPISIPEIEKKSSEKNVLLFLGRIGEGKGFWDILKSLSIIKKTHNNFIFKYGGDGELDKANDLIIELGLENFTEYKGWVTGEEKQKLLNESLIYLLPSYNEGLPIGILEAMASKVPVVTCPVGGIPDAISDGVNGLLVQPGDVNALSNAIIKLIESTSLCNALTSNAYDDVLAKFSVDVVVPQISALYHELSA